MNTLEAEVRELKLYLAAVIRLLVARGVATQAEFARFGKIGDCSDGAKDGQFGGDIARREPWTGPQDPADEDNGDEDGAESDG
jgi:hypothetical protein